MCRASSLAMRFSASVHPPFTTSIASTWSRISRAATVRTGSSAGHRSDEYRNGWARTTIPSPRARTMPASSAGPEAARNVRASAVVTPPANSTTRWSRPKPTSRPAINNGPGPGVSCWRDQGERCSATTTPSKPHEEAAGARAFGWIDASRDPAAVWTCKSKRRNAPPPSAANHSVDGR